MILRIVYLFLLILGPSLVIVQNAQAQDSLYVIVGQTPSAPLLSANKNPTIVNEKVVLVANGCTGQVVWSDETIGASRIVSLERTTEFRARCVTAQRCTSSESKLVVQVTLNSPQIEGLKEVCEGQNVTLTARGCPQETRWQDEGIGEVRTFQPTVTTTYYARCTQNGMVSNSIPFLVTVNPKPAPPTISKSVQVTDNVNEVSLLANCSGATVRWDNGSTQPIINVVPVLPVNTYSAICISAQGCQSESSRFTLSLQVNKPSLTASHQKVCAGQSVSLMASNCNGTYLWSSGESTSVINPIVSNTSQFWVKCKTTAGLSESVAVTIEVTPTPTSPVLLAQPSSVLFGQSSQLTASGCNGTVKWSNQSTGNVLKVTPTGTSTYEAYCETQTGCRGAKSSILVTVYPSTTRLIASPAAICQGEKTNLKAVGCKGTVTWLFGYKGDSVQVVPTRTTTYLAVCQTGDVKDTNSVEVLVYPLPNEPMLTANKTQLQSGELVVLNSQGCSYRTVWDTGIVSDKIQLSPQVSTEYGAYCQNEKGCNSKVVRIKIQVSAPTLTLTANRPKICQGETTVLLAEGCQNGTLTWELFPNQRSNSLVVQPSATTIYKAKCETLSGISEAAITITVNTKTRLLVSNVELCENATIDLRKQVLNANSFGNLLFRKSTPNSVNVSYIQTLTQSGIYYVIGTNPNTCLDTAQLALTVYPKPAIPSVNAPLDSVMAGSNIFLQGKGCENGTLRWWVNDKVEVGTKINFVAEQSARIKVVCVNAKGGCVSDTNFLSIPVKQGLPILSILSSKSCEGGVVSLEVKGCAQGLLVGTPNAFRILPTTFTLSVPFGRDSIFYSGAWIGTKLKRGDSLFVVLPAYCYTGNINTSFKSNPRRLEIPIQFVSLTDLYFYPNPAAGKIRIRGRDCVNGLRLKVWDLVGRLLLDGYGTNIDNEIELDVSTLASGEYLLEIQTATGESNVSRLLKYSK